MFGLLKFNMEGSYAKPVRHAIYRKSNPCQFFNLDRAAWDRRSYVG
jgi:hypothetical protein